MSGPVITISPNIRDKGPSIVVQPEYVITLTTKRGDMQVAMGVSGGPRGYPGPPGPPGEGIQDDPGDFTLLFENRLI